MKSVNRTAIFILLIFAASVVFPLAADEKKKPEATAVTTVTATTSTLVSKFEDLGVDLVVSKVKITRGTFAGERKIQFIPYIKNMCNTPVTARIKIYFPDHSFAEWIEDGIGPKQEKAGGAMYRSDRTDETRTINSFRVIVDNNNEIKENNDSNNECRTISIELAPDSSRTITCTLVGPHCRQMPSIKKYQMR